MVLGKFPSDGFEIFLNKTHRCNFYRAVGVYQEAGRHIGQTVGIGCGIALGVQHNRKGDSVLVGEFLGGARVVLRNSEKSDVFTAVTFVQTLQKWEGELANWAGNFKERNENGAAF